MTFQPENSSPDGYFSYSSGSTQVYPLPTQQSNSTAATLLGDQVIYQIGNFFRQILNNNLNPRFSQDMLQVGISHANLPTYHDGYAVAQVVDYALYPHILNTTDYQFPLLSVVQTGMAANQHTIVKNGIRRDFQVSWIMPPMTGTQSLIFQPYLSMGAKAWLDFGGIGYDPKVSTQSIWLTSGIVQGALGDIRMLPFQGTQAKGSDWQQVAFPALTLNLSVWEDNQLGVTQLEAPLPTFTEAYIQVNMADGYNINNPFENVADGYAIPNLSISSLSVVSGSLQGETLVFISGQGFLVDNIYTVSFNGAVGKTATVRNVQMLQVITNPSVGGLAGTGNVVITDQFGQTYQIHNGWTYTSP